MENQPGNMDKRDVTDFSGVQFKGVGRVEVKQGDRDELVIEALPEICARIHAETRDGVLVIYYESDWMDWTGVRLLTGEKVIFHITMREINSLALSGVGSIDVPQVETEKLTLSLSGPGSITIGTLKAAELEASLSGVGSIDVAGSVPTVAVNLSGAGNFKASRLESETGTVKLSGVGNATVWVEKTLRAPSLGLA